MKNRRQTSRVAVLSGGSSAERNVSLESGRAVTGALQERGHFAQLIDPATTDVSSIDWVAFDVAFLALHGTYGEDGQVQEELEHLGVPYTGSRPLASRIAFSKSAAKERFVDADLATPPYVLIHSNDSIEHCIQQAEHLTYPVVVKPDAQGSSHGVSLVTSATEMPQAVERAASYDQFLIIERAVLGSEWTVTLLDDMCFPVLRIGSPRSVFDYHAKYHDDATNNEIVDDASESVCTELRRLAQGACHAIGTTGLVRVDLRTDEDGAPYLLEVNTIPGFTSHSLAPMAAAHVGLSLGELCERVVASAIELDDSHRRNSA